MPPKLLYLITSSAWGGAERYVARLADAASGRFDVAVAAGPSPRGELFKTLSPSVGRIQLKHLTHPIAPLTDLRGLMELRALFSRERFDLVHVNSSKAGLLAALAMIGLKPRPKLVYTAHGWGFLERRSWPFRATVLACEKIAALVRNATIVLSDAERRVALEHRLSKPEDLWRIPLGLDADEISFLDRDGARQEIERASGSSLPPFVFGTIANAYPSKALPLLLEAFDAAAPSMPEAGLVIIGGGPGFEALREARARLARPERAFLTGILPDAARLLPGFDAFVLASLKEGLPWTILEASLAGLPIVATRVGALPELIDDGETGLLLLPGDRPALAAAFSRLYGDPALREMLAAASPRIASALPASAMLDATFRLYHELLNRSA